MMDEKKLLRGFCFQPSFPKGKVRPKAITKGGGSGSQKPDYLNNVPNLLAKRFQRDQDCLSTKDWQSFCLQRRLRPSSLKPSSRSEALCLRKFPLSLTGATLTCMAYAIKPFLLDAGARVS